MYCRCCWMNAHRAFNRLPHGTSSFDLLRKWFAVYCRCHSNGQNAKPKNKIKINRKKPKSINVHGRVGFFFTLSLWVLFPRFFVYFFCFFTIYFAHCSLANFFLCPRWIFHCGVFFFLSCCLCRRCCAAWESRLYYIYISVECDIQNSFTFTKMPRRP